MPLLSLVFCLYCLSSVVIAMDVLGCHCYRCGCLCTVALYVDVAVILIVMLLYRCWVYSCIVLLYNMLDVVYCCCMSLRLDVVYCIHASKHFYYNLITMISLVYCILNILQYLFMNICFLPAWIASG